MGNIIDFSDAQVKNSMKKVAIRNGMNKHDLKRLEKISVDEYMTITSETLKEFQDITNATLYKIDEIRASFEEKDLGAFGYAMTSLANRLLSVANFFEDTEDVEKALEVISEYQEEYKYLFLETNIFFKVLNKLY